jgi:hypothetical protein
MSKVDWYVLTFNGPKPARAWFRSREAGIKARNKFRKEGYHVLLTKVNLPEVTDAKTTRKRRVENRDHNSFLTRIADRFRRRNRST